jgi:hypothetical protein
MSETPSPSLIVNNNILLDVVSAVSGSTPLSHKSIRELDDLRIRQILENNGLAPSVYPLLTRQPAGGDGDAARFFKSQYENALIHKDLCVNMLCELKSRLCAGGRVVIMQGLALAENIYHEPMSRQMSDIDLYLPDNNGLQVRRVLAENGFSSYGSYTNLWYRQGLCIDLHESLWGEDRLPYRRYIAPSMASGVKPSGLVDGYYIPDNTLAALHAAFHGLKHGFARAVWMLDVLMLWNKGYFKGIEKDGAGGRLQACALGYLCDKGLLNSDAYPPSQSNKRYGKRITAARYLLRYGERDGVGELVLAMLCSTCIRTVVYFLHSVFPAKDVLMQMYGKHSGPGLYFLRIRALCRLCLRVVR